VIAMSASLTSVLAILEDGSLWMWEDVDAFDRETREWVFADWSSPPVWIMNNVTHVAAGWNHHLVIDADGVLWAWGTNNESGKIGDGTDEPRPYPVPIMEDVVYAVISPVHPNTHVGDGVRSYAITADGTLWGWGQNGNSGELPAALGDGTDIPRRAPVRIMDSVSSVTPTRDGAYATTKDGAQWWWGPSYFFDEEHEFWRWEYNRLYPAQINMPRDTPSFPLRHFFYEIDENGTLWTWGRNQWPEHWDYTPLVGDGTTVERTSPVRIMDNVLSVSPIADTVFVIDADGTLWAWGANNLGQLGDGTTEARLSPVPIMENVAEVAPHYFMDHGGVGFMNTFVLTRDGELWRIGSSLRGHGGNVSRESRGDPGDLPIRLQPR